MTRDGAILLVGVLLGGWLVWSAGRVEAGLTPMWVVLAGDAAICAAGFVASRFKGRAP